MTADAPDVAGTVFEGVTPVVAKTYAVALVNAAAKEGQVEAALEQLETIRRDVLGAVPRFRELLDSPSLPPAEKQRLLTTAFAGNVHPVVNSFLQVLNQHGRLNLFDVILSEAKALWDRRQNRKPVTVRTAVALEPSELSALHERLTALTGGTPVVTLQVDPTLIGGLVVQVGDDVYDASVRTQLELMRRRLIEVKSGEIRAAFVAT